MSRHIDWLAQGHNDIEWAEHSCEGGFYIPARYLDAFPACAPFELFGRDQAEAALADVHAIAEKVR